MEKSYSNVEILREQQVQDERDICGFCGLPGADKIPHPIRWPDEHSAGTDLVHTECEAAECARASALCQGEARTAGLLSDEYQDEDE